MNTPRALFLLVALSSLVSAHAGMSLRHGARAGTDEFTLRLSAGVLQLMTGTTSLWRFDASSSGFVTGTQAQASCPSDDAFSLLEDDINHDGAIDAASGERRYAVFAAPAEAAHDTDTSTATARLFAIDISDPRQPRLLWSAGEQELPGLGAHPASAPLIARVHTGAAAGGLRDAGDFVVILGSAPAAEGDPSNAARIFMLDASSGRRLWSAARAAGADMAPGKLTFGFAAAFTALDMDGDEYADRLYAADAGGQLWRFDTGRSADARSLISGGVIAHLLDAAERSAGLTIVASPDVALMHSSSEGSWFSIAVGTAQRAGTLASAHGWLFSVHEHAPFERWNQARYDTFAPLDAGDLSTIVAGTPSAANDPSTAGWKVALPAGAEVRTATLTAAGTLLGQIFSPVTGGQQRCEIGANQMFALTVEAAAPALDLNGDGQVETTDTWITLGAGSPAPAIQLSLVPQGEQGASQMCAAGIRGACIQAPRWLRTFWTRADAQ